MTDTRPTPHLDVHIDQLSLDPALAHHADALGPALEQALGKLVSSKPELSGKEFAFEKAALTVPSHHTTQELAAALAEHLHGRMTEDPS